MRRRMGCWGCIRRGGRTVQFSYWQRQMQNFVLELLKEWVSQVGKVPARKLRPMPEEFLLDVWENTNDD